MADYSPDKNNNIVKRAYTPHANRFDPEKIESSQPPIRSKYI